MSNENKKYKDKSPSTLAPKLNIVGRWTSWRASELKNRKYQANDYAKRLSLKSLMQNVGSNSKNELMITTLKYKLWELNKRSSFAKTKNYCYYIGRARSVNRKLFMARHTLRKFVRFGMLPGFIHAKC